MTERGSSQMRADEKLQRVQEHLTEIFQKIFRKPDLMVAPEHSAKDIPGWDSLANIQLILSVEAEFKIRFSSSEIVSLKTIADLLRLITSKIEN